MGTMWGSPQESSVKVFRNHMKTIAKNHVAFRFTLGMSEKRFNDAARGDKAQEVRSMVDG